MGACIDCGAPNTPVRVTRLPLSNRIVLDAHGEPVRLDRAGSPPPPPGGRVVVVPAVSAVRRCDDCLRAVEEWKAEVLRTRLARHAAIGRPRRDMPPAAAPGSRAPAAAPGSRTALLDALDALAV